MDETIDGPEDEIAHRAKTRLNGKTEAWARRRRGVRSRAGQDRDPAREDTVRPRLPRPPAAARLTGARADALIDWDHLLVNGGDGAFRRAVHGLAALVRRLDVIHDLIAADAGIGGTQLEFLLAVIELVPDLGGERTGGDGADADGVALQDLKRRLDVSDLYVSQVSTQLVRRGLLEKGIDPARRSQRRVAPTDAGRAVAEAAAPLIRGAHNIAFAPLTAREFRALQRIAAKLDAASASAVDALARRRPTATPETPTALRAAVKRVRK